MKFALCGIFLRVRHLRLPSPQLRTFTEFSPPLKLAQWRGARGTKSLRRRRKVVVVGARWKEQNIPAVAREPSSSLQPSRQGKCSDKHVPSEWRLQPRQRQYSQRSQGRNDTAHLSPDCRRATGVQRRERTWRPGAKIKSSSAATTPLLTESRKESSLVVCVKIGGSGKRSERGREDGRGGGDMSLLDSALCRRRRRCRSFGQRAAAASFRCRE